VPGSVGTHGNDAGRAAIGGVPELIKRYEDSVVVLMIEKKGAVENLEGIVEAYEHTIKTAIRMGVRPRAEISMPEEAEYYMNLRVKDFNLSTDTAILAAFYRSSGSALHELVAAGVREPVATA